jgi:predicted amidophosphoribosyltransferase
VRDLPRLGRRPRLRACRRRFGASVHAASAARCGARRRRGLRRLPAQPAAYDSALAALDYAHPWDRLIAPFKFHAALDLAPALARLPVDAWTRAPLPIPACCCRCR